MKKLLLRADDLGFSEAVNYGIARTVQRGLIRNCGVMVNMEATEHAVSKQLAIALEQGFRLVTYDQLTNSAG